MYQMRKDGTKLFFQSYSITNNGTEITQTHCPSEAREVERNSEEHNFLKFMGYKEYKEDRYLHMYLQQPRLSISEAPEKKLYLTSFSYKDFGDKAEIRKITLKTEDKIISIEDEKRPMKISEKCLIPADDRKLIEALYAYGFVGEYV